MKKLISFITILIVCMVATSCDLLPTPSSTPTDVPISTLTPTLPVPTPIAVGPILECKQTKCPIFAQDGVNDSGKPILAVNTGNKFYNGDRIQFYDECRIVDGGDAACEIYRDLQGDVYKRGYWLWRDQLKKVW